VRHLHASLVDNDREYLQVLRQPRGGYLFHFYDGTRFRISRDGARVVACWPRSTSFQDVTSNFLGLVLGFVVRLRGTICLHASAVLVEGSAVAFLGPGGYGKSTMCACFAAEGDPLIADDVLALAPSTSGYLALPGAARIRLWPDSAKQIYGAATELPRLFPSDPAWDKRFRDVAPGATAAPLVAIYAAEEIAKGTTRFSTVSGKEAFFRLAANLYPGKIPVPGQRRQEFDVLAALASSVPLRRLRVQRGLRRLPSLRDAVRADLARIRARTPVPARSTRQLGRDAR